MFGKGEGESNNWWWCGAAMLAVIATLLSGCQTGPRAYDGGVGYQLAQADGTWYVRYTDEATHTWKQLEQEAVAACAIKTGTDGSDNQLIGMKKASFVDNVPTTVTYPAGSEAPGTVGDGGAANVPQAPVTFTAKQQVTRRLALRQVMGQCPE